MVSDVAIVTMEYGYLKEDETNKADEHSDDTTAASSLTMLVMAETKCESVWSYALDGE